MIVLTRNYGQLGNRLFLSAHLMAAAREYGLTFSNPAFAEYAQYFTGTANDIWCRYPRVATSDRRPAGGDRNPRGLTRALTYRSVYLTTRLMTHLGLKRFPAHILRLDREESCDLAGTHFRKLAASPRPLLLSGWRFRSPALLEKHIEAVREHFQIIPLHRQRVDEVVASLRQTADRLIGIHIRHGDFAQWEGGKYFYSIGDYVSLMRQIQNRMRGQNIAFLVCGNAKLNRDDFGDLNVHFGTGHVIEDMYAFAEMDFLVGPPSTYTGWASFYGGVPLEHVERADQQLDLAGLRTVGRRVA